MIAEKSPARKANKVKQKSTKSEHDDNIPAGTFTARSVVEEKSPFRVVCSPHTMYPMDDTSIFTQCCRIITRGLKQGYQAFQIVPAWSGGNHSAVHFFKAGEMLLGDIVFSGILHATILSRFKFMAGLHITKKGIVQVGSILDSKRIQTMNVVTFMTPQGESILVTLR